MEHFHLEGRFFQALGQDFRPGGNSLLRLLGQPGSMRLLGFEIRQVMQRLVILLARLPAPPAVFPGLGQHPRPLFQDIVIGAAQAPGYFQPVMLDVDVIHARPHQKHIPSPEIRHAAVPADPVLTLSP